MSPERRARLRAAISSFHTLRTRMLCEPFSAPVAAELAALLTEIAGLLEALAPGTAAPHTPTTAKPERMDT